MGLLNKAAKDWVDQICRSLEILRKERKSILVYKAESEKESYDLLRQMDEEREKTAAAFRQLHQFLEEQEKLLLARVEEVKQEIARSQDEHIARLSGELSSLNSFIQEVEEKQQQQSENELLQVNGDVTLYLCARCKRESFENPGAFPIALMWKIHDFCDINPFLEAIMKQFKDSLLSGLQIQEANVSLDPETAHPGLIVSEDHKCVTCEDEDQDLPDSPERFEWFPYVLGCEEFTAGRHFWEVAVESEDEWAVGVARKSVRRKGDYDPSPAEGMWNMGMWDDEYRVSIPPEDPSLSLSQELKKIRVTLNCAGRRVAFFDADTGTQLYVFSDASFCGEAILPFFCVSEGGHLTICP
ncbi:zinc finger protein RFP-like [Tiliqua scincoides]|uniref:zinc finger protein RFP-like n=1 Tax=Tiliqua scincoides TaxID=71010 RepID=UPI003462CE0A